MGEERSRTTALRTLAAGECARLLPRLHAPTPVAAEDERTMRGDGPWTALEWDWTSDELGGMTNAKVLQKRRTELACRGVGRATISQHVRRASATSD